jgi:hypothetical protein
MCVEEENEAKLTGQREGGTGFMGMIFFDFLHDYFQP